MVKATAGLLINWYRQLPLYLLSDASIREILLHLDQQQQFIIADLDTNHLFIDGSQLERVKGQVEAILAENVYQAEEDLLNKR